MMFISCSYRPQVTLVTRMRQNGTGAIAIAVFAVPVKSLLE